MGIKEETSNCKEEGKERKKSKKEGRRRRKRGRKRWKVWAMTCFNVSCFGTATATPHPEEAVDVGDRRHGGGDASEAKHSSWFWKRKARRTVPVDSSLPDVVGVEAKPLVETERGTKVNLSAQVSAAAAGVGEPKPSLLWKLFAKVRWKKRIETGPSELQQAEAVIIAELHNSNADAGPEASWMSADHRTSEPTAATGCSRGSSSLATFYPIFSSPYRNPAKPTGQTLTEKEEREAAGTSSGSKLARLIIPMLLILSLIVGGRTFAIVCTCTCFYLMPSIRGLQTGRRTPRSIADRRSTRRPEQVTSPERNRKT